MRQCSVCLFALVWILIVGCGPIKLQSEDCPNTPFVDRTVPKGPECSDPRPDSCHRVIVQRPASYPLSILTQEMRRFVATTCGVPQQTPDSDIVRWLSENNVLISIVTPSGATVNCSRGDCDLAKAVQALTVYGDAHHEILPERFREPGERRRAAGESYVQYVYHCRLLDVLIHCPAQ